MTPKSVKFTNPKDKRPNTGTCKVEIEIPRYVSINVPKMGKVMTVHIEAYPARSLTYLLLYGFRQQQDVHSNITKKCHPDEAELSRLVREALEERFGDLERGDTPKGSGRRTGLTPLQAAFFRIVSNSMTWSQEEQRDRAVKLGNGQLSSTDLIAEYATKKEGRKATQERIATLEAATWKLAEEAVARQEVTIE